MDPKTVKKRKSYTLKEKLNIIELIKSGKPQRLVALEKGVTRDTISTIWKSRSKIINKFKSGSLNLKKNRQPKYPTIDKSLYDWLKIQRINNTPLPGNVLQVKATEFANKLGITDFKASNGWFQNWKARFDISFGISGESASADLTVSASWLKEKWPFIKQGYKNEDIFSADETALFFKMIPEKTFRSKNDAVHGVTQKKDRVTIMVCASMTGEKKKLFLIGKSKNPRCFPQNQKTLPLTYASNRKASMNGGIFEAWIRDWNEDLRQVKRKILLLVDNCSAHIEITKLSNIQIEYFPSNLTSGLQPMNQGIIRNLKMFYRRFMIDKIISHLEVHRKLLNLNLLDAVNLITMSWNSVTSTTINNCFRHAKLCEDDEEVVEIISDAEFIAQNESLYSDYFTVIGLDQPDDTSISSLISIDNDVPCGVLTSEEMLAFASVQPEQVEVEDFERDEDLFTDDTSPVDVYNLLQILRKWIMATGLQKQLNPHVSTLEMAAFKEIMKCRVRKKL